MTTGGPNPKKYYVSYVVQPGQAWGHAALLLRTTQDNRFGKTQNVSSTLYDFKGSYPYDDAQIGKEEFDPSDPNIKNIEHHILQYQTWEVSEANFKKLTQNLDKAKDEQDTKLTNRDRQNKPLFFHPVTQNCKTFAVGHLSNIGISAEELEKLNNPFIPIPIFSGKLNKIKDITEICETLGTLDLMIDDKLSKRQLLLLEEVTALTTYKKALEEAKKNLFQMNTSLPVQTEAERIIKDEFSKIQAATQACERSLRRTKFTDSDIMNEFQLLLDKLKEYFRPTLEGQMKNLPPGLK